MVQFDITPAKLIIGLVLLGAFTGFFFAILQELESYKKRLVVLEERVERSINNAKANGGDPFTNPFLEIEVRERNSCEKEIGKLKENALILLLSIALILSIIGFDFFL